VGNGNDEEAVAAVGNTGQGVVPGSEGCHETKETTGLDDGRVGLAGAVALDVADTEEEEGEIEEEEQQEESHSGSQGAEQQDGGEDEPALQTVSRGCRQRTRTDSEELTIRNRPKEFSNMEALPLSALIRAPSMLKPPGVKTIAKEIQKPP
jgi:hypothetical protein